MSLTDRQLADMYSRWSEDTYCAGWLSDGEGEFVDWLLGNDEVEEPLKDYELESIAKIRRLIGGRMLGVGR